MNSDANNQKVDALWKIASSDQDFCQETIRATSGSK